MGFGDYTEHKLVAEGDQEKEEKKEEVVSPGRLRAVCRLGAWVRCAAWE